MRTTPPPLSELLDAGPAAGDRDLLLRVGALDIVLAGIDAGLSDGLSGRFGPYVVDASPAPDALIVRVTAGDRAYFIDPPEGPALNRILIAADGDRVRFAGYRLAGWFEPAGRGGGVVLGRGDYEPAERAIENYVRAAVAWRAAERGGALVHAASAVWRDRGYLFFGPSGIGKSTLSASNRRGRVVSDDLSLLLPGAEGGLSLVGSPFRGTYEDGRPVIGAYPLAAGFRLHQAARPEVREAPRVVVLGELVGNLPFVAEAFGARPDLFARVEAAFADVPLAHLHFTEDDAFWDAIAAAGYA